MRRVCGNPFLTWPTGQERSITAKSLLNAVIVRGHAGRHRFINPSRFVGVNSMMTRMHVQACEFAVVVPSPRLLVPSRVVTRRWWNSVLTSHGGRFQEVHYCQC